MPLRISKELQRSLISRPKDPIAHVVYHNITEVLYLGYSAGEEELKMPIINLVEEELVDIVQ